MATGSHPAILLFKMGTIIFSFSTFIASIFLLLTTRTFYPVLVETSKYCEADKKRVDFEHNIELCYENCYQTWLLTRMFKYTLMERRDYKNLKSALSIVKKFCDDHKKAIDTLRMVVNKLDDLEELKENRYYCPRSELDLPVNRPFRELSKEKQSVLLRNLELAQNKNY